MTSLFVYGTLMNRKTQRKLLGRTFSGQLAVLPNFTLIRTPAHFGCYPIAVPRKNGAVVGLILRGLTSQDFKILDEYEEVGHGPYQRIVVSVKLESGEFITAFLYGRTRIQKPRS